MALVVVPDCKKQISDNSEIQQFLSKFNITYEHWEVEGRINQNATEEEILKEYQPEIERLKKIGGYVTADVINVSPATPGLDVMLDKFNKEHTHDEDEVRFVVAGRGVFHINPVTDNVFAVEMGAGDLISVPRGTRHWFNLCQEKTIRTIRLFQQQSGWTPYYIDEGVHERFDPVCLGVSYLSGVSAPKREI
jgi:1,2-dihydroxy-3-keto-5-methylthiopentene dioxygenase